MPLIWNQNRLSELMDSMAHLGTWTQDQDGAVNFFLEGGL